MNGLALVRHVGRVIARPRPAADVPLSLPIPVTLARTTVRDCETADGGTRSFGRDSKSTGSWEKALGSMALVSFCALHFELSSAICSARGSWSGDSSSSSVTSPSA